MIGVYLITFDGEPRGYVGSSADIERRFYDHCSRLRRGDHHCIGLQAAYDRLGPEVMRHEVLFECGLDDLGQLERQEIEARQGALLNSYIGATFNRTGMKMPDSAKAAISENLKGNSYRKGIAHDERSKKKISDGLKKAFKEGRRKPSFCQHSLDQNNKRIVGAAMARARETKRLWDELGDRQLVADTLGIDERTVRGHLKRYFGINSTRKRI